MTVSDMFTLMPYENSLVALEMNGPQLKAVLERAYRNYYYYKYVPGFGGYSYYTTCMIDINAGGQITYRDVYPELPDGNNVLSLVVNGKSIDFTDASKYYKVSTVNYLAAGSCNFNDSGVSLWPLSQITNDTQYYVRDAVIDYVAAKGTVSPKIEGRLLFPSLTTVDKLGTTLTFTPGSGLTMYITIPPNAVTQTITLAYANTMLPTSLSIGLDGFSFLLEAVKDGKLLSGFPFSQPIIITFSYTDDSVAGLVEDNLKLYYWDGSAWMDAACGSYSRHPADNWLSVPVCHLSNFSLAAKPLIYLPYLAQNH
jgi:hypothetical protein